jgi:hypothetical protein
MEPNWTVAFYETARGEVPARAYLDDCPRQAREVLLRIVVEVARSPPPSFRSPRHWRAMHGSMRGLYEARDRHGDLLYRLFCVVDALAPAHGHAHKLITLIDGGTNRYAARCQHVSIGRSQSWPTTTARRAARVARDER